MFPVIDNHSSKDVQTKEESLDFDFESVEVDDEVDASSGNKRFKA